MTGSVASKYQKLVKGCKRQGWRARCEPLEEGCRCFGGQSLCRMFTLIGINCQEKRKAIRSTTEAAEKGTNRLWIKRTELWENADQQVTSLMMCPNASA